VSSQEVSPGAIDLTSAGACLERGGSRGGGLAIGLSPGECNRLDALSVSRTVKRGSHLVRAGDRFHSLHLLDRGLLKGGMVAADGREQVVAFYLPGEPLGLDAIASGMHCHDVLALEESRLRAISYDALERLSRALPQLQRNLSRMMSGEIVRSQGVMWLLGSMRAEQRVAAVLLSLSRRLQLVGLPAARIDLRITRRDLGSYIGLSLETVSRELSRMENRGLISLQGRSVELLDSTALEHLVHAGGRERPAPVLRLARVAPKQPVTAVAASENWISSRR
jgi:CRP/FNR family transcriptional regulator, anaerobic regulatory protein